MPLVPDSRRLPGAAAVGLTASERAATTFLLNGQSGAGVCRSTGDSYHRVGPDRLIEGNQK